MQLEQQIKAVSQTIEDLKGENTLVLSVLEHSSEMEAIIISSGRSIQHTRGIANNIKLEAKRLGMTLVGIEGTETGEWILIDLAEVVVHIMTQQTRDFYQLEKLWDHSEATENH